MAVLPTLRRSAAAAAPTSFAYIDTPDFDYCAWLTALQQNADAPIGSLPAGTPPRVAVIGAGVSGLCASYELLRAGASVDLFEASNTIGGRAASVQFPNSTELAELGSMRFPPSEFTLFFYLQKLGVWNGNPLQPFPDPGVNPTFVCYGGAAVPWTNTKATPYPAGFENVYNGWNALMTNGITQNGVQQFLSCGQLSALLQQSPPKIDQAAAAWQSYISTFGQMSFYSFLYLIFSGTGPYDLPAGPGSAWSFDDFGRFGSLGLGSGGFGPLYPIGATEILRIVINGLENTQLFLPEGAAALPNAFYSRRPPTTMYFGTEISGISQTSRQPLKFTLSGTGPAGPGSWGPYDRVIVATTTRAMEMTTNLTNLSPAGNPFLAPEVAQAITRTHVASSTKVGALINKFWEGNPNAIRCLLSDNDIHQIYTLDYDQGQPGQAMCFITYSWEDDAIKQLSLGVTAGVMGQPNSAVDKGRLYQALLATLQTMGPEVAAWAENLVPLNGDYENNVLFTEWQSNPYFAGAFKLAEPGQDPYVEAMYFDYQKVTQPAFDTGVYIAGDCIDWNSGWTEGALRTALNAACAVIYSAGGSVNTYPTAGGPMNPLLIPWRYTYFGPTMPGARRKHAPRKA